MDWTTERGNYPAKGLDKGAMKGKTQTTRLLKGECPTCGCVIRIARAWAERGMPVCGVDDTPFELA